MKLNPKCAPVKHFQSPLVFLQLGGEKGKTINENLDAA